MIDKDLLNRLVNKITDCLPESLIHCQAEFKSKVHDVAHKVLSQFHIVTETDFEKHLELLQSLKAKVQDLEERVKAFEKNKK